MNKFNIFLIIIISIIFITPVTTMTTNAASAGKIIVLNMNYHDGNITLLEKNFKYGFYPDRRYQPENGYKIESVYVDGESYSFRFKNPGKMFVDVSTDNTDNGTISGGIVELSNTNFSLIMPNDKSIEMINIYSPDDKKVAVFSGIGGKTVENMSIFNIFSNSYIWILVFVLVVIGVLLVILRKKLINKNR